MGSLRPRCAPTTTNEGKKHCLSNLSDRIRNVFSCSSCPGDENDSRVMKQLVTSIECEPLKQGESEGQCEITYTDIPEPPYRPNQWPNKGVLVALVLTFLSLGFNYVMWLTNAYDNAVLKLVSIRDDIDMVFDLWRMPPTKSHLAVYLFNYTNPSAVINGSELPNVKEVGPFVFREKMERINVHFNDNSTVSFQEQRLISYDPEESVGSMNDKIYMPNVLLISSLKRLNIFHFMEQHLVNLIFKNIGTETFPLVTVNESIWGFHDAFFEEFQKILPLIEPSAKLKEFGFLEKRAGIHSDIVTMKTGGDDLNTIGIITRWNGQEKIGVWGNNTCDEMEGSDGTLFPAKSAQEEKPLFIYSHGMCRRIPIIFNKTTLSRNGFPVQQYNVYEDMFDFSGQNEENSCFKYQGGYPPNGVFNTAPCQKDAPLYVSFPHFWRGGEEIRSDVTGLNPDAENHRSYFHIHKDLGICLLAKTRFQLNIELQRSKYMTNNKNILKEKLILPIAWLDYDSGELPEHFVNVIYHLTYTAKTVKRLLKWIFLLWSIISLVILFRLLQKQYNVRYRLH